MPTQVQSLPGALSAGSGGWRSLAEGLRLARGENDLLFDLAGRAHVDLFSGHGSVFLGHGRRAVVNRLAQQLGQLWIVGGLGTVARAEAQELLESWFPPAWGLAGFYSTGMEAAEFALRLARVTTGRPRCLGFSRSMHGKSFATAALAWQGRDGFQPPQLGRLPFPGERDESEVLEQVAKELEHGTVAALFVEPFQASGGGRSASGEFLRRLAGLCTQAGTWLVIDEILTGFHRTGPAFVHRELDLAPDVVLVGKAMGNGFPVSAVLARRQIEVRAEALPGSTFAGNALAAAAVAATLAEMRELDLEARVAAIDRVIRDELGELPALGVSLRGRGALFVLQLPPGLEAEAIAIELFHRGALVSFAGNALRLLPAATIERANLCRACCVLRQELTRAIAEAR